ncbi:hypothetical protein HZC09_03750 [Candidatus Micrarchaeota archaeon]|nr:hypothetical protein [Candidatus Micrarchaeota archaeon]
MVATLVGKVKAGTRETEMAEAFYDLKKLDIPERQHGTVSRAILKGMTMKTRGRKPFYLVRAAAIRALHELDLNHTEEQEKKLKERLLEIAGETKVDNDEAAARAAICLTLKNWKHPPNRGHDNIRIGLLNGLKQTFISDQIGEAIRAAGLPDKRIVAWLEKGSATETEAAAKYVREWMEGKTTVPKEIVKAMEKAEKERFNNAQFYYAVRTIGEIFEKLKKK